MFGLIIAGRPVVEPASLQSFSPTEHAYTVPASPLFSHIVVFLAPGAALPHEAAVGVFVKFPKPRDQAEEPGFRLLGGLSADKQSAIFRVSGLGGGGGGVAGVGTVVGSVNGVAEVDMDADEPSGATGTVVGDAPSPAADITIGLLIQSAAELAPQLAALAQQKASGVEAGRTGGEDGAMTRYRPPASNLPAKTLAQRIIKNAFNYLTSFAQRRDGEETVPLRAFEQWWRKTESRFDSDPGFLEREIENG